MQELTRHQVVALARDGVALVEVLGAGEYRRAHLPSALHIPLSEIAERAPAELDRAAPVIVYCFDSL